MNVMIHRMLCEATMTLGERVTYALQMLIVGLGMVFAVLALLWGVLAISRLILRGPAKRPEEEPSKASPAPVTIAPAPVSKPVSAPAQDSGALIAVITAAISAAMAEEGTLPPGGFRVVSFRRAGEARAWNRK